MTNTVVFTSKPYGWTEEAPTMQLRVRAKRIKLGPEPYHSRVEKTLQQMWKVTRGGTGEGVTYSDEWRDVPFVFEE